MTLYEDDKEISSIWFENSSKHYTVGLDGVTKIECYEERGEMATIPWFKVWRGDQLHCRVNARYVSNVVYEIGAEEISKRIQEHDLTLEDMRALKGQGYSESEIARIEETIRKSRSDKESSKRMRVEDCSMEEIEEMVRKSDVSSIPDPSEGEEE